MLKWMITISGEVSSIERTKSLLWLGLVIKNPENDTIVKILVNGPRAKELSGEVSVGANVFAAGVLVTADHKTIKLFADSVSIL